MVRVKALPVFRLRRRLFGFTFARSDGVRVTVLPLRVLPFLTLKPFRRWRGLQTVFTLVFLPVIVRNRVITVNCGNFVHLTLTFR